MSLNLNGKVALVTGGSKGIGAATCRALGKAGASVVINYSSDSSAADALVNEIGPKQAIAVKADASSVKGAEEMVKATMDKFGRLDILIANAGKCTKSGKALSNSDDGLGILPMKTIEDTTEADFDAAFALNVKGPYFLVQVRSSPTVHRNTLILVDLESCSPHEGGISNRSDINYSYAYLYGDAKLSPILCDQGSN